MKACRVCGIEKPDDAFEALRTKAGTDYRHATCRECRNAQRRAAAALWYERNRAAKIAKTVAARAKPKRRRRQRRQA